MNSSEIITLENEHAVVQIKLLGAELCSFLLKGEQQELIWNGDEKYWKRHAPVLFPIVGKLKNNNYYFQENNYSLPQHGFARDVKFQVKTQSSHSCTLVIKHTAESLKKYPFEFSFTTTFSLINKSLTTSYEVQNIGGKTLLFSLGAHPAFNCPFNNEENLEDYSIVFSQKEKSDILLLGENGLISKKRQAFLNHENRIDLNENLFKNDALIFDDLTSKSLVIQSRKHKQELKISWENFPHLGIWKPERAPFLCIEPWHGMADKEGANGQLEDKFGMVKLAPNELFKASYTIELNV